MKPDDFQLFFSLVKQRSGLHLSPDKVYLLESRLGPVARRRGMADLDALAQLLRDKRDEGLMIEIAEAMTTNETSFFRDQNPFDKFRNVVLPRLIKSNAARKHIRIWSAASSSGQEAYSLAMICAEESARLNGWKIEIIGTDFSNEMVKKAQTGIYSQFEVQRGLSAVLLIKYFTQLDTDKWQINPKLRQMVQFRYGNLLEKFRNLGAFDVIFCRNVLIYFESKDKTSVLNEMHESLAPGGMLMLGGAETVIGINDKFKSMDNQQGVYVSKTQSFPQSVTA